MPTTQMQTAPSVISCEDSWYRVQPEFLPEVWPIYRRLVCSLVDLGEGSFDERDILALLLTGHWMLIAIDRDGEPAAIGILEAQNFPRQRKLIVRGAAGDKELILSGQEYIAQLAKEHGCQIIEIYGRKGWERLLPNWKVYRTVYRKEVS